MQKGCGGECRSPGLDLKMAAPSSSSFVCLFDLPYGYVADVSALFALKVARIVKRSIFGDQLPREYALGRSSRVLASPREFCPPVLIPPEQGTQTPPIKGGDARSDPSCDCYPILAGGQSCTSAPSQSSEEGFLRITHQSGKRPISGSNEVPSAAP